MGTGMTHKEVQQEIARRHQRTQLTEDERNWDTGADRTRTGSGCTERALELLEHEAEAATTYIQQRTTMAHGHLPQTCPDGAYRLLYTNLNGLATLRTRELKSKRLRRLIDYYEVNILALNEIGVNFAALRHHQSLPAIMGISTTSKSSTAHNRHENFGKAQQGGAGVVALGEACQYVKPISGGGKDPRGLGRWASLVLSAHPNRRTRIVSAYNVGRAKPKGLATIYQQHLRYTQTHGISDDPREMMRQDLVTQVRQWIQSGESIILAMDANEDINSGRLCLSLTELGMVPSASRHCGFLPPTHASGSHAIDEIWSTPEVEVTGVLLLPFHESVADHRTFLLDFTTRSTLGLHLHRIVRAGCRRLVLSNKRALAAYTRELEYLFRHHRIEERIQALAARINAGDTSVEVEVALDRLDIQIVEIQRHCEDGCRKIYRGPYKFSPPIKYWYERRQAIRALLKRNQRLAQQRRVHGNPANLRRLARRRGVPTPCSLTDDELRYIEEEANTRLTTLSAQATYLRHEHLSHREELADRRGDQESSAEIRDKRSRERTKTMWFRINRVVRDPHPGSLMRVQRSEGGTIVEYTEEEDIVRVIQEETVDRFSAAAEARISNCSFGEQLGPYGLTPLGREILSGTNNWPTMDLDDATRQILQEIGDMSRRFRTEDFSTVITSADFQRIWKTTKETTSSSFSGIHFGHYKAAATSNYLSQVFAEKLTLTSTSGIAPDRWKNGLMVMLEKVPGVCLANRLRAILLMEADNNYVNGVMFGDRMLTTARRLGLIPQEQIAERQRTAEDGAFTKILKADYSRQRRQPLVVMSVDAANCYDRVNHVILALMLMALGIPAGPIIAMLLTIRQMKYYLRTGFGESTSYMGGNKTRRPMHGMCQGNRASPACWSLVSAVLAKIQRSQGHTAKTTTPITGETTEVMGCLFVDDTDLFALDDLLPDDSTLWSEAQLSLDDWGHKLNATGGALKPPKCYVYWLRYVWNDDGSWDYRPPDTDTDKITVPTIDGDEPIEVCGPHVANEMLGVVTSPDGKSEGHFTKVLGKMEKWVLRMSVGNLPPHFVWTSYYLQLWPGLRYGIGTLPTTMSEASGLLDRYHRQMLPMLGVNRNIRTGWRTLHPGFLGVGLYDFPVEMTIEKVNLFLQHYGAPTDTGNTLQANLETLQLECGFMDCPFNHPYHPVGPYATHSWVRSLWECVDYYKIRLYLQYPTIHIPRERDGVLTTLFLQHDDWSEHFLSLNRCRLYCTAIFLSDLATIDGRHIHPAALEPEPASHHLRSSYRFPSVKPSTSDWQIWRKFWAAYTGPRYTLRTHLGPWTHPTHRVHNWWVDRSFQYLCHGNSPHGSYYERKDRERGLRSASNHYALLADGHPYDLLKETEWRPASVMSRDSNTATLLCTQTHDFRQEETVRVSTWRQALDNLGDTWLWEDIELVGNETAILGAIQSGTALWVTDGSYDRRQSPTISGVGWFLYAPGGQNFIRGSFYEVSAAASSYRAELLGLTALHVLARAFDAVLPEVRLYGTICCDNEKALQRATDFRQRIPPGSPHADLLRLLRNTKRVLRGTFEAAHIYGHADDIKPWARLTLRERLNCACDIHAKQARARGALAPPRPHGAMLLPGEQSALYLEETRMTGDISVPLRYWLGYQEAQRFYVRELGWSLVQFQSVDWEYLSRTITAKPKMYQLWLTKQASKFSGTRLQLSRITGDLDSCCPNCGYPDERTSHLNQCRDPGRTLQFKDSVKDLEQWMARSHTHPEIQFWVPRYLLGRGCYRFDELPQVLPDCYGIGMSSAMRHLAQQQDSIGWTHFLEGKVGKAFRALQRDYMLGTGTLQTGGDWTRGFIDQLLRISHSQWIYRNVTLHDKERGYLVLKRRQALVTEITAIHDSDTGLIPPESRFLLDLDVTEIAADDTERQEYWVAAIRAARVAGRRIRQARTRRQQERPRLSATGTVTNADITPRTGHHLLGGSDVLSPPQRRPSEAVLETLEASNRRRKRRRRNCGHL